MDYVYDIILNFQNDYYEFYEWLTKDKIINVNKIPIYKITNKAYLDFKYHDLIIDIDSLPKRNKMFLVTSGLEILGILIDNNGKIIKRSSLLPEEADDILNDHETIKRVNVKYRINSIKQKQLISRLNEEKRHYINHYFNKLDKQKDEYFLKYLYFEIYNQETNDIDKAYNELLSLFKNDISKMYYYLKKVNLELNKQ